MPRHAQAALAAVTLALPLALPVSAQGNQPEISEYDVPWEGTRPRDPYVAPDGRVWFVGQGGNYLAVNYLIPDTEGPPFGVTRAELQEWFGPHFRLREEWMPRSYPNRTNLELMLWWQLR